MILVRNVHVRTACETYTDFVHLPLGWMGGVLNMPFFIQQYTGAEYPEIMFPGMDAKSDVVTKYKKEVFSVSPRDTSLTTAILSAGTFFGAIIAGDLADAIGRRFTIIIGCGIFTIGGILEVASTGLGVMVAGRLIAGFGVGFISAIVILYMSEIAPKKVRGAVVAGKSRSSTLVNCMLILCRLPILYYHWYLACQLRRVRHPGPP
jgi:MFS family permease